MLLMTLVYLLNLYMNVFMYDVYLYIYLQSVFNPTGVNE